MRRSVIISSAALILTSALPFASAEAQKPGGAVASECERVVRTFIKLDGDGAQLTEEGRRKVSAFFTQPSAAATTDNTVTIVEDGVDVLPIVVDADGRMRVGTQALYLGTLTVGEALAYDNKEGQIKTKSDFVVSPARPSGHSTGCRIEGSVPGPQLTLSAAIRHVTALRDKARGDAERRRFTRALNGLKRELPRPSAQ